MLPPDFHHKFTYFFNHFVHISLPQLYCHKIHNSHYPPFQTMLPPDFHHKFTYFFNHFVHISLPQLYCHKIHNSHYPPSQTMLPPDFHHKFTYFFNHFVHISLPQLYCHKIHNSHYQPSCHNPLFYLYLQLRSSSSSFILRTSLFPWFDHDDMATYPPISNLSLTSKLLKRAVHAQLLIRHNESEHLPSVQSV